MNSRRPTGDDIATLLLMCAPKNTLEELGLSEERRAEFLEYLRWANSEESGARGKHCFTGLVSLAIYYSCKSTPKLMRSYDVLEGLQLRPEEMYGLVQLTMAEKFGETEKLLAEVAKEERIKKAKKAIGERHSKPDGKHQKTEAARKEIRRIWATGKYRSRQECAYQECGALDMAISVAVDALKNTANPDPWPAKNQAIRGKG